MKYTDVAWDFDGCLYDSYPHINADMQYVLEQYGVRATLEEINRYTRITQGDACRHFAPLCGCEVDELVRVFQTRKNSYVSDLCRPYPGIPELLRDLTNAGIRNHICSNKKAPDTLQYLDRDGLTQYFDVISGVDRENGVLGKPKPDILNVVLRARGISPKAMIMVGDRPLDIEAAHNAGCDGCFFDLDHCNQAPADVEYEALSVEALRSILLGE